MQIVIVGKRGIVTIPADIRKRYGLEEASPLLVEEREDGILFRPAVTNIKEPARFPEVLEES